MVNELGFRHQCDSLDYDGLRDLKRIVDEEIKKRDTMRVQWNLQKEREAAHD